MHTDELDDDHPLWLVNEQIKGLLEGDGAGEDHEDVLAFLRNTGLPEGTVTRMHRALVCAEKPSRLPATVINAAPKLLEALQTLMSLDGHSALTVAEADEINRKARAAITAATGEEA